MTIKKMCNRCLEWFQGDEIAGNFYANTDYADGRMGVCKGCLNVRRRELSQQRAKQKREAETGWEKSTCGKCADLKLRQEKLNLITFVLPCAPLSGFALAGMVQT